MTDSDYDAARAVLNVGAGFAALQVATDLLERAPLDDEDFAAIAELPDLLRMNTVARVLDATESLRASLRDLDFRLLTLHDAEAPEPSGSTAP